MSSGRAGGLLGDALKGLNIAPKARYKGTHDNGFSSAQPPQTLKPGNTRDSRFNEQIMWDSSDYDPVFGTAAVDV